MSRSTSSAACLRTRRWSAARGSGDPHSGFHRPRGMFRSRAWRPGRNAALETACVALELGKLADASKQTTVNVSPCCMGGDKVNVIPDRAVVKADVRVQTARRVRPHRSGREETGGVAGDRWRDHRKPSRPQLPAMAARRLDRCAAGRGRISSMPRSGPPADACLGGLLCGCRLCR